MSRPPIHRALVTIGAVGLLTGCLPDAATAQGREVSRLYGTFMIAAAGVFVIVVGLLAWSIVRYRGPPGRDVEQPRAIHGNTLLEVVWWALPTALVAVLAAGTIGVLAQVDAREPEPGVTVEVDGFQWGWRFTFPQHDGVSVSGTAADPPSIQLPVGETIAFLINSEDVVHSFNIPQFLIKRDAVPSRENRFDVLIDEEGLYGGQCGEFCGLLHAQQLFSIEAVSRDAFDAWISEQGAASDGG
jgi:cytochrome c oxidase subunit II